MKVSGVCKDCVYSWQYGAKNNPQHAWCCKRGGYVKNTKMKACNDYEQASENTLKILRKRRMGN